MGKLDNKVAIVTGAGRGIGRGIAEKLAAEGATVVVTDIDEQSAKETTANELGGGAIGLRVDVTDRESVDGHGRRRSPSSSAGSTCWSTTPAGTRSARSSTATRPTGTGSSRSTSTACCNTSKAVLPIMAAQGSGQVVNLGSDAGRVGSSGEAVYSAAKGGVIAFTKATAREMARTRSTSTASAPDRPTPRCSPPSAATTPSCARR